MTFGHDDECPVLEEIEAINSSPVSHFVLVDDARLFLAPPPIPHRPEQWPDIMTICAYMAKHSSNRYVVVHEDVIVGVPNDAKGRVIDHIRTHYEVTSQTNEGKVSERGLIRRLFGGWRNAGCHT